MKTKKTTIISPVDGLELAALTIEPDEGEIKAVFQLVHGMAEMKERYIPLMEYLAGEGYACVIHDHRGHGESVRDRTDYGYLYGTGGDSLVEDAHMVTQFAKATWPGRKIILFGHSMGSLVVRCYTRKYDGEIDGLIVMGSPAKNGAVGVARAMVAVKTLVQGPRHKSRMITKMAFGNYLKNIPDAKTTYDWLSVNEDNVARYIDCETCGFIFTLDGYRGLFDVLADCYDPKGWAMSHRDLPVLFLSGSDDPCIDGKKNFYDAIKFMKDRGYDDVENRFYKGLRHEILNEDSRMTVYHDISDWAARKLG